MARKIAVMAAGGRSLPLANAGLRLSKTMDIDKIEEHARFRDLYTIDDDLLGRIADDMRANRFDASQPVHIWLTTGDDGEEHPYLIDGYTRVMAARQAGLTAVPYFEHRFGSFEEAHRYALHLQVDRRNLSGMDLLRNIGELMGSEYVRGLPGNKNAAVGEMLGVSEKTVERANFVGGNATDEQLADIESGAATINSTYNDIKRERLVERSASDEQRERMASGEASVRDIFDEIKESRKKGRGRYDDDGGDDDGDDGRCGTPSALNFSHTDGIRRPHRAPGSEDETDLWLKEKNAQARSAYVEGFVAAAEYVLCQWLGDSTAQDSYREIFCGQELTRDFLESLAPSGEGFRRYAALRAEIAQDGSITDFNPRPMAAACDDAAPGDATDGEAVDGGDGISDAFELE